MLHADGATEPGKHGRNPPLPARQEPDVVRFLVSARAGYATGQVVTVDGGG